MSTPSDSKAAAKPKRPLSGYNLFYRYKRNKILEATARPGQDNEAVIRAVLTALPGLEGVPPNSPLVGLPQAQLGQFRSAAIRYAMKGKLFPNENTRSRVHRKVLGMGFVEMGRMMREMWGQTDKLAKDVFAELADVGRVRYRKLMAEYKLSNDHPTNIHAKSTLVGELVKSSMVEKAAHTQTVSPVKKEAMAAVPAAPAAKPSPIPQQASSSSDPMPEAPSVRATKTPPPDTAATQSAGPKPKKQEGSRPNYARRVSPDLNSRGPVPCQARSSGCGRGNPLEALSFNTMINPTESANETDGPATPRISNRPKLGKRPSADPCLPPPTHGGTDGAVAGNGTADSGSNTNPKGSRGRSLKRKQRRANFKREQILLRKAIKQIRYQIAQNNSVLPPEMQIHPRDYVSGEKACPDVTASSGPSSPGSAVAGGDDPGVSDDPKEGGVSARDFMDFIVELDDAIDINDAIDVHAIKKKEDLGNSLPDNIGSIDVGVAAGAINIFGKPMFEMPRRDLKRLKPVSPTSIPMPAGIELKTNRACMA